MHARVLEVIFSRPYSRHRGALRACDTHSSDGAGLSIFELSPLRANRVLLNDHACGAGFCCLAGEKICPSSERLQHSLWLSGPSAKKLRESLWAEHRLRGSGPQSSNEVSDAASLGQWD